MPGVQLGRKSTRGLVPRTQARPTGKSNWAAYNGTRTGLNCTMTFRDDSSSESEDESSSQQEELDPMDLDEAAERLGFKKSLKPFIFKEPTPSASVNTLRSLSEKLVPPEASYAVVWIDPNGEFASDDDAGPDPPPYNDHLKELLDHPTRYSKANYELKGNCRTGQAAVFAKKDISEGTPVGLETGAVWTEQRWLEMDGKEPDQMIGLFATDIPSSLFTKKLGKGYKGGNLVYDCTTHGNELRFLHDPTWYCSLGKVDANTGSFVVLTKKRPYVHLVYFALTDIKKKEEFVVKYGDKTWDDLYCLQLAGQSRLARAFAKRVTKLEDRVKDEGLQLPSLEPCPNYEKKHIVFYDTKNDTLFSTKDTRPWTEKISKMVKDDPIAAILLKVQRGSKNPLSHIPLGPSNKMPSGNCAWPPDIEKQEVLDVPEDLAEQFRESLVLIEDDREAWNSEGERLRTIADGNAKSYVRLVKIDNPYSPARLFTPPAQDAFAVVAAQDIKAGFPILQYSGKLVKEEDESINSSNAYLYELDPEEMAARGYNGSTLLVNASTTGGVSRFINDIWTPRGFPKREPNCYISLHIDPQTNLPVLICFAQRDIKKGEELMYDYGSKYWRIMFQNLMHGLTQYALESRHRCHQLMNWLNSEHKHLSKRIKLERVPGVADA